MYKKKMPTKGLKPPKPKADLHALERLPQNPSSDELKSAAVNISLADLEERVADVQDQWEESSLFEDALDELTDESTPVADGESFSFLLLPLLSLPPPSFLAEGGSCYCFFFPSLS